MATTDIQTCYRHPDRKAGVRCQRCERPICPDCMHQASVGFHCPECAKRGRQRVYTARALATTRPVVTLVLVAINAVVYLLELTVEAKPPIPLGLRGVADLGEAAVQGVLYGPAVAAGDWWRPITAGFLHASPIHIGLNMFILWQLGILLEVPLGRINYLVLYFMALLGGSALVLGLHPDTPTLGASGAVFGLMGAAFVGLRSRGIDPFSTAIGPLIVINLVFTFVASSFVSVGGHLGGLIAGAAGGWLLFELAPRLRNGKVVAPAICAGATVALFLACLYIANNPL